MVHAKTDAPGHTHIHTRRFSRQNQKHTMTTRLISYLSPVSIQMEFFNHMQKFQVHILHSAAFISAAQRAAQDLLFKKKKHHWCLIICSNTTYWSKSYHITCVALVPQGLRKNTCRGPLQTDFLLNFKVLCNILIY